MANANELIDLINLIKQYITNSLQPKSFNDIFVAYWIPIIQVTIILLGAIAGLWKYYRTKNKEIYEKILNEVYAPLYQYLVKQELYRKIHLSDTNYKDTPILEITNTKTTTSNGNVTKNLEPVCNLNRKEIISIKNNVNIGLASQEMLTLLNMYEVLVYMEDKYDKDTNEFLEATLLKVEIENALRKEIISGYKKYHKLLGLRKISKSGMWVLTNDNIVYSYSIDEKDKKLLRDDISKNYNKYIKL